MELRSVPLGSFPPPAPPALDARTELEQAVSGRVSSLDADRLAYARDFWPLGLIWQREGQSPPPPDLVAWPSSQREALSAQLNH